MSTDPSNYKDKPDKELTLVQRLCKQGKHDLVTSTSGMSSYCKREGCGYYWEYD